MPAMTASELADFLDGRHLTDLVTLHPDGGPHVAPVWYQYVEGRVLVMASGTAVKARNIRRDPRVALSIATPTEPYLYVVMEGTATVRAEGVEGTVREICVRYRGPERGGAYARELIADGDTVVIEVTPSRVMTMQD